jgi:hypothetical protein
MATERFEYFARCDRIQCPSGQTAYDPRTAWWMAQCSKLAYEPKPLVRRALKVAGFEHAYFFDTRGTQGYLALHPGQETPFAVLAYRGTEKNYLDIVTDILILKTKLPDAEDKPSLEKTATMAKKPGAPLKLFAHGGFMEAFLWVWGTALPDGDEFSVDAEWVGPEGVSNLIKEKINRSSTGQQIPLYVTGHSLGGALATLTAYHALVHHNDVHLYTFGCPRVANRSLAEQMDAKLRNRAYRCVHGWDIVPRIPPFFSYHHTQQLMFFNRDLRREVPHRRVLMDSLIIVLMLLETLLSAILAILLFPIPNGVESAIARLVSGHQRASKVFAPMTTSDHRIDCYISAVEQELGSLPPAL